jgi:hypothetical protein
LRVTEQDVVNEEMYEEEDDDLPMQYRRLTAHLQTGSADFNRRLSAYLTNHVAMRSALDQAITSSYAQQYPNAPQFAHNHQNVFPSPFLAHNLPPHQQQQPQPMPQPFVPAAYNVLTGTPSYRTVQQMRSASMAGPRGNVTLDQNLSGATPGQGSPQVDQPLPSMPTKPVSPTGSTPTGPSPPFMQAQTPLQQSPPQPFSSKQMSPPGSGKGEQASLGPMHGLPMQHPPQQSYGMLGGYRPFPFTTSLPTETQLMLGPALDPNDPMTSMFMAGSENMIQPFYDPMPSAPIKPYPAYSSYDGMSATLAPSALDMPPQNLSNLPAAGSASLLSPFPFGLDGSLSDAKGQACTRSSSSQGSGVGTPGLDIGWESFINDHSWSENAT